MPTDYSERRWSSRDGLSLFARDYAADGEESGLPVICLHGLTRNSKDFAEIASIIAGWGRRVIAADVRGRGQSDRDPKPDNYQPKIYARDVVDMMSALGIPKAVFIGTSMGGIITMMLMGIRPKAVAAAILNDVGPKIAPEGVARILGYAGQSVDIRDWDQAVNYIRQTNAVIFPHYGDDDWRRFTERTFRQGISGPELDYDQAIKGPISKPPSRLALWLTGLLFRRLARSRPTLLIRGGMSDLISPEIAQSMQNIAPRMQRVDIPGVGHAPMLNEPEAVDAIREFLRTVP